MRKTAVSSTLVVCFDGQFWVGIVERVEDGALNSCRVVFVLAYSIARVFGVAVEDLFDFREVNDGRSRRTVRRSVAEMSSGTM